MISAVPATPVHGEAASVSSAQLRTGLGYLTAGRIDEAIEAFQRGIAAVGRECCNDAATEVASELHSRLGNACMLRGDLALAGENYKAALRLAPHLTVCWCNLGNVYLKSGMPDQAIALYVQALTINPTHWPSRTNLVEALMASRQHLLAKVLLMELIEERPLDAQMRNQLGKLHVELGEFDNALDCFRQALVANPDHAESIYWIGSIKQRMGEIEAAEAAYARAAKISPLIRRPAVKSPAEFRVLALFAPFVGNTPAEYLMKDGVYDTDTFAVFSSCEYDVDFLKRGVDVVVNLISDADQAGALLPLAADLAARFEKPIVNHPARIQRTTRDAVTLLLQGIPRCRLPRIVRQKAASEISTATVHEALSAPIVLMRPAGTHGGDDFERIDQPAALIDVLARPAETDRYFIEYIDYRSGDGYFRKYRFIFVDGQILPYHLAISDDWKVHHDSSDMIHHKWMQREEQAFLEDPASVFQVAHFEALGEIQRRVGLDYFGIDCALDPAGNLVAFEVNASMLVHEHNEDFPYKAPFVGEIKCAFDDMLRRMAATGAVQTKSMVCDL